MATTPLFVVNMTTLKHELRLSGVPDTNDDVQYIIERAVLRVRLEIYQRLSAAVVSDLLAISYSANPTTANEQKRALANLLEIEMVRGVLFRELPTLFMDASGTAREDWNTNGANRSQGDRLPYDEQFVDKAVALLTGDSAEENLRTFSTSRGAPPMLQPLLRTDMLRVNRCPPPTRCEDLT